RDATLVHDGCRDAPAWVWDIAPGPVIAFASFPSLDAHHYHWARWDGIKWRTHDVTQAGNPIDTTGTEHHYSGGIALDHDQPDVMYLSVQRDNGWSLLKMSVCSLDGTNKLETITDGPTMKNVRPVVVRGDSRVCWLSGDYDGYRRF